MIDAAKVIEMAGRELERLQDADVVLKMNIIQAVKIIALIQLSLRHPDLPEENKTFARAFCVNLIELIERASSDLANFCRLGFEEKYDTAPGEMSLIQKFQAAETCRDHWKTSFEHERETVIRLRAEIASQHAIHYEARGGQCECRDCQLVRSHAGPPA